MAVAVIIIVPMIMSVVVSVPMVVSVTIASGISMVAVVAVLLVLAVVVAIVPVFLVEFIAVELVFPAAVPAPVCALSADGERAVVAEPRIVGVVNISTKTDGSTEPWSGADKDSACVPLRAVVAERRALIRRVIEVAVGTNRCNTDADADLCCRFCTGTRDQNDSNKRCGKKPGDSHGQPFRGRVGLSLTVSLVFSSTEHQARLSKVTYVAGLNISRVSCAPSSTCKMSDFRHQRVQLAWIQGHPLGASARTENVAIRAP